MHRAPAKASRNRQPRRPPRRGSAPTPARRWPSWARRPTSPPTSTPVPRTWSAPCSTIPRCPTATSSRPNRATRPMAWWSCHTHRSMARSPACSAVLLRGQGRLLVRLHRRPGGQPGLWHRGLDAAAGAGCRDRAGRRLRGPGDPVSGAPAHPARRTARGRHLRRRRLRHRPPRAQARRPADRVGLRHRPTPSGLSTGSSRFSSAMGRWRERGSRRRGSGRMRDGA